jgi:signal transduction histidine kinase
MRLARYVARHAFDAAVVAVAAVVQIEIWAMPVPGPKLAIVPGMLLATLPLLLRHRFPFAAPACVFAVLAGMSLANPETVANGPISMLFALLLAFWAVGESNERHQAIAGVAIGLAAVAIIGQSGGADLVVEVGSGGIDAVSLCLVGGGLSLGAFALQRRAKRARELEERATRLERAREERARAAVAAERVRIARDLHDVIAHSVGVMTVQAGAARVLLDEEPERAREPVLAVEETGRQALAEMRRLLGILRSDESEAALAPQPGLADLGALLEHVRKAGLPVELIIEGEPKPLAPGIALTVYRIVHEALTNVLQHGGPARAQVIVRYTRDALDLEIANDGHSGPDRAGHGGQGLVAMRERVALYGGELEVGSKAAGGFAVRARLPLGPA